MHGIGHIYLYNCSLYTTLQLNLISAHTVSHKDGTSTIWPFTVKMIIPVQSITSEVGTIYRIKVRFLQTLAKEYVLHMTLSWGIWARSICILPNNVHVSRTGHTYFSLLSFLIFVHFIVLRNEQNFDVKHLHCYCNKHDFAEDLRDWNMSGHLYKCIISCTGCFFLWTQLTQLCSTTRGTHIFQKSRSHLKILDTQGWHEPSNILRIHKYWCHYTKFSHHGNLASGIYTPPART
jgi:hypothetical protein